MKRRAALLLGLAVALAAKADDLSSRTRQALHQALELHATEPVGPPSFPQALPAQVGVPSVGAAAAAQATQSASKAQTDAANQAAQDVANGRGRSGNANDASRDAAGQKRGGEAKSTGGTGASGPHGPPDKAGKPSH